MRAFWFTCIVLVFWSAMAETNIAFNKTAYQSGNYFTDKGYASWANDANPTSAYLQCAHSKVQYRPWWIVDLGRVYFVNKVTITARNDVHSNRLNEFSITVGSHFHPEGPVFFNPAYYYEIYHFKGVFAPSEIKTVNVATMRAGRYLKIEMPITQSLSLCDVKVFGVAHENATQAMLDAESRFQKNNINIALHRTAYQISNHFYDKGYSWFPTNGRLDNTVGNEMCTFTKYQSKPWWLVDLGQEQRVAKVFLTNRNDAGSARLANFDIFLGDGYTRCGNVVDFTRFTAIAYRQAAIPRGATEEITTTDTVQGRYMLIRLRGINWLHLCEVQVFRPL